jgi:large subunit ribosomal protein L21e
VRGLFLVDLVPLSTSSVLSLTSDAVYHGKTGIVYNVTPRAVGVICYKVVNGRYIEKRVNIRIEHIRHSKCRQEFLDRVKSNAAKKREAKENGTTVQLKRLPAQPREAHVVSIKNNVPQTLTAQPCESARLLRE